MYDRKTLYEYHKYLRDNNCDISFTTWSKKNHLVLDNNNHNIFDDDLSKSDIIAKIKSTKNKKKGIKLIYKLLSTYYKDKDEYNDILN